VATETVTRARLATARLPSASPPRKAGPAPLLLPPPAAAALPHLPTAAPAPPTPPPPALPPVAICAIVRDQTADLPEWVAWHLAVGVSHIFLYDHASSAPPLPAAVLQRWIRAGVLTLIRAPREAGDAHPSGRAQLWAYDDCLTVYGKGIPRGNAGGAGGEGGGPPPGVEAGAWARVLAALETLPADRSASTLPLFPWLAFIDVDEFIMPSAAGGGPPAPDAIPAALSAFEKSHPSAGGLALNWVIFGSSGHAARPAGGALASYTACLPPSDRENAHIKSIVRTDRAVRVGPDPHHFLYAPGHPAANSRGQAIPGPIAPPALGPPAYESLALYHYATKSVAEYGAKMARGSGMGNAKKAGWLASVDGRATGVCLEGREAGAAVAARGGFAGVHL
jgi:hypothetical protein